MIWVVDGPFLASFYLQEFFIFTIVCCTYINIIRFKSTWKASIPQVFNILSPDYRRVSVVTRPKYSLYPQIL